MVREERSLCASVLPLPSPVSLLDILRFSPVLSSPWGYTRGVERFLLGVDIPVSLLDLEKRRLFPVSLLRGFRPV